MFLTAFIGAAFTIAAFLVPLETTEMYFYPTTDDLQVAAPVAQPELTVVQHGDASDEADYVLQGQPTDDLLQPAATQYTLDTATEIQ